MKFPSAILLADNKFSASPLCSASGTETGINNSAFVSRYERFIWVSNWCWFTNCAHAYYQVKEIRAGWTLKLLTACLPCSHEPRLIWRAPLGDRWLAIFPETISAEPWLCDNTQHSSMKHCQDSWHNWWSAKHDACAWNLHTASTVCSQSFFNIPRTVQLLPEYGCSGETRLGVGNVSETTMRTEALSEHGTLLTVMKNCSLDKGESFSLEIIPLLASLS